MELGLNEGTTVASSMIDAHAGAVGLLGCQSPNIEDDITTRLGRAILLMSLVGVAFSHGCIEFFLCRIMQTFWKMGMDAVSEIFHMQINF